MADQANFPDIYIDESVTAGGVGSLADPYSDFSEINWTTGGDNSVFDYYAGTETASCTINLQRGQTWREWMVPAASGSATYPIIIRPYGTGADPIIDASTVATSWTERAWLAGWNYRKKITIDNTNVDGDLTWFPLFVDITADSDIGGNVSDTTNGYDIRFTEDDGKTLLAYEREYFNVAAGDATGHFWVSATGWVIANGSTTDIYIYYNDDDGTVDGESAADVWDTNYKLVMHLSEASGHPQDSSGNANHATSETITTYEATGKVKFGMEFDGSSDIITVPDSADFTVTPYTVDVWAEPDGTDASGYCLNLYASGEGIQLYQVTDLDGRWRQKVWHDSGNDPIDSDDPPSGSFELIAGVRETNGTTKLYVDGAVQAATGSIAGEINSTGDVKIGNTDFDGVMDEFRFSNTDRSANWLKFQFNNINEGDNELAWDSEEAGAPSYYKLNINPAQGYTYVGMVRVDDTTILTYNADEDALAEGEYHHNVTDDDLYIRLSGDADPSGYTIEYDEYYASIVSTGKDYITVENLTFKGGFDGIRIQDGCDHWIIQDCTTRYNAEKGVKIQGDNVECTYNTIQRMDIRYCGEPAGGLSSYGIQVTSDVANASSNNTIQNNLIRDTVRGAFSLRHADSNIFRYNKSHRTGESCILHDDSDSNEWYYNIFDHDGDNDGDSIFYLTGSLNNEIYNNVLLCNGNDLGIKCYSTSTGTIFKNNIYYGSARCISVSNGSETNFDSNYNCLYVTGATFATWMGVNKTTFANWKDDSGQDANTIIIDPTFTDAANDDFTLLVGSPCINAGTDVSLTTDYAGNIVGALPDIGAYELIGAISTIPPMMGGDYYMALG